MEMERLNEAYNDLLRRVFGDNPEDFFTAAVPGALFDKHRREVEREYDLHADKELYLSWQAILMFNAPQFITD